VSLDIVGIHVTSYSWNLH